MGDVIAFRGKKNSDGSSQLNEKDFIEAKNEVIDITQKRSELINRDRRAVKRTLLTEFIAVHVLIPGQGLLRVTLHDIHEKGIAFDIEASRGRYQVGEEVAMRVYLNHKTYFSFVACVKNTRFLQEEDTVRHGAEFAAGTLNEVALFHFIKFIENISASLKSDKGDITVSQVNS